MKAEESSPGGKCKRTGNLLCVCLLSPGHASEWQTCVSVPLLRNPLQVERHQGLACGGCIFLFIIDDPDPDRQHTTHVIWIHFWFQMHALVWTWLWAIIVCGGGTVECMWECVCVICIGGALCLIPLTADSWFDFPIFCFFWGWGLVRVTSIGLPSCIFVIHLDPVHVFTKDRHIVGWFAATSVDCWRLIDQGSKSWGVCLVSPYCFLQIHLVFSKPWWFVWPCVWCELLLVWVLTYK